MIPVALNDVCFSIHAVALTAFTLFQVIIYDVSIYMLCYFHILFILGLMVEGWVCAVLKQTSCHKILMGSSVWSPEFLFPKLFVSSRSLTDRILIKSFFLLGTNGCGSF